MAAPAHAVLAVQLDALVLMDLVAPAVLKVRMVVTVGKVKMDAPVLVAQRVRMVRMVATVRVRKHSFVKSARAPNKVKRLRY